MSTRDQYPAGVPCFVDTLTPDVEAAKRFYAGIFGWEFAGPGAMPDDPPGEYYVARVGGDGVAAIGTQPATVPPAAWNTYIAVDSADEAAAEAQASGGTVLAGPFDVPPAGRMAVVADPAGATFCVWEAGRRTGAARVNEPSAWAMSLLSTGDPESAQEFYGRLFGWRAEPFGRFPTCRRGSGGCRATSVANRTSPSPATSSRRWPRAGSTASWSVDFWIEDADAAAAGRRRPRRVRDRGSVRSGRLQADGSGRSRRRRVLGKPAAAGRLIAGRRESETRQQTAPVATATTRTAGQAPITSPSTCESANASNPATVSQTVVRRPSRRSQTAMHASPNAASTTPPSAGTWPAGRPGCARRLTSTGRWTVRTSASPIRRCACAGRRRAPRPVRQKERSPAGHGSESRPRPRCRGGSGLRASRPSRRTGRLCRDGGGRQGSRPRG